MSLDSAPLRISGKNTNVLFTCPECNKEISNPQKEFHIGREIIGEEFHYALCSCPECKVCTEIMAI